MTILIVDDNEQNLYQLQVLLGGNGYQVVSAAHGAEALARARQNPPDLIISDILMPVMDGFALCREWKKDDRLRSIPFVFYTATYTDERDREFALGLGAERFLVKPEDPDAFMRMIREVIGQIQGPASTSGPVESSPEEEAGYLKQYNEVLVRKLEFKLQALEKINRDLERSLTERQRVDEALRESEERFHGFFQIAPECCYMVSPEGLILDANDAAVERLGYTRNELIGQPMKSLYAAESAAEAAAAESEWLQTGRVKDRELILLTRAGKRRTVLLSASAVRDAGGRVLHSVSIEKDITERKEAEEELRASRAFLDSVINTIADPIFVKDDRRRFVLVNEALCAMVGCPRSALIGEDGNDMFPKEQVEVFLKMDAGVLDTGTENVNEESVSNLSSGEVRTIVTRKTRYIDPAGKRFLVGVIRDITERNRAAEQMVKQVEELRRWHEVTLGREERIAELKRDVNELLAKAGQPPRFESAK